MASTAVITIEGVLQKNVSYSPIPVGLVLYHSLTNGFNVALVTDGYQEEVDYWLSVEGLNTHGTVVYNDFTLAEKAPIDRRLRQINSLRARQFAIDLIVEPDPAIAAALLRDGYTVLNFLHYSYALPQWRPDYERKIKPWAELEQEAINAALLRSKDARLAKNN